MDDTKGYCVVLTTCPNAQEAHEMASQLIGHKLAACVQMSAITSYYEWKGTVHTEGEQLLLIKAKASHYDEIEEFIAGRHSYEVPEIVRIPIEGGLRRYLDWIDEVSE